MLCKSYILVPIVWAIINPAQAPGGEMRPATEREIAFYTSVMTAVEKALPQGPMHWQIEEMTPTAPPKQVAAQAAWHPFPMHYSVTWVDRQRKKLAILDDKHALHSLEKAEEARARAEAQQKLDKVLNEREEAYQGRDLAAAQVLEREIENLTAEIERMKSQLEEEAEKADEESLRGMALQVALDINLFSLPVIKAVSEEGLVPVPATACRQEAGFDSDGRWQEGSTMVFLGRGWKWTEGAHARMQAEEPVGLPSTRVYTLVVRVQGEHSRVWEYLRGIDWLSLEGLLFK